MQTHINNKQWRTKGIIKVKVIYYQFDDAGHISTRMCC